MQIRPTRGKTAHASRDPYRNVTKHYFLGQAKTVETRLQLLFADQEFYNLQPNAALACHNL